MNYLSHTANIILKMKRMIQQVINLVLTKIYILFQTQKKKTLFFFKANINNINDNEQVEDSFGTARVLEIDENQQRNIIETYPLHPMCEWNPPSANIVTDKTSLFVKNY